MIHIRIASSSLALLIFRLIGVVQTIIVSIADIDAWNTIAVITSEQIPVAGPDLPFYQGIRMIKWSERILVKARLPFFQGLQSIIEVLCQMAIF